MIKKQAKMAKMACQATCELEIGLAGGLEKSSIDPRKPTFARPKNGSGPKIGPKVAQNRGPKKAPCEIATKWVSPNTAKPRVEKCAKGGPLPAFFSTHFP
jgi:hypothetical protein